MQQKEKLLDYQEFYEELVSGDYLPTRIDYDWSDKNEDFMREVLFSFYTTYSRLKDPEMVKTLLKLYSEVMLAAHTSYPEGEGYF